MGGTIEEWHAKLCLSNKGILYQDQFLQIGVKADYRRHEGRVTFFLGNKHTGDLTNCIVSIPPLPSYRVQLGPAPKTIAAQAQVQLPFSIACLEATLDAPTLQVAYDVDGQSMKTSLRLPVLPIKFFVPVANIDASTFFAQWKSIAEPPLKLQQVVQVASPLDMGNIKAIFTQAGMGVAEGLDPNPNNIVGIASFCCEMAPETAVMVRMEVDPNTRKQFRITLASQNGLLSSSTKEFLLKQIQM